MKQIILLDLNKPKKNKYQFFLDWFKEAWINNGGLVKSKIGLPKIIPYLAARAKMVRNTILSDKKVAILAIGGPNINRTVFPYSYFYEVIPVCWDTWPKYHSVLISGLKSNRVKYAFFTQREVAQYVKKEIPNIETFWLPEGINIASYNKGTDLIERSIDILQYGRRMDNYHEVIMNSISNQKYLFTENLMQKLFNTFQDFVQGLSESKIIICFPRCDTHPEIAGSIETMTQRYWEGMLSRCVIIGRAPIELIDFMGYNPVIEIDWVNPEIQLKVILNSIENYQSHVDKNYEKAIKICSWDNRINDIKIKMNELGYKF